MQMWLTLSQPRQSYCQAAAYIDGLAHTLSHILSLSTHYF